MSQKYHQLAKKIVELVGGKDNIQRVYHCQTRLRFKLYDEGQAKTEELEALEGVIGVVQAASLYQVVIGTHVADVFEEITDLIDLQTEKDDSVDMEKKNPVKKVIEFIAAAFTPIIPAISGAGMVKAVLSVLMVFNIVSPDSTTYIMLNIFADGVFYFLPILLAFTALVSEGETVSKGQAILSFDKEAIVDAGYDIQTMVIVTNTPLFKEIKLIQTGLIDAGQDLLELEEI